MIAIQNNHDRIRIIVLVVTKAYGGAAIGLVDNLIRNRQREPGEPPESDCLTGLVLIT